MSVNSLGYLSGLTTDFTNVRAMGDFAVDGVLTVQNFSANSLIGHLSANTINAESGSTIGILAALSTNTLAPGSGSTLRIANGASLILRSIDSGGQTFDVKAFGAVGDGATDDTAALATWALAVAARGDGYLSDGTYKHDGTLTIAPTRAVGEARLRFGAEAYLAPTAGWGLKLNGAFKTVLEKPKVKLIGSSTATCGILIQDSRWVHLEKPVVWSDIEIPADFTCIDVDDDSYWCEVEFPVIRKNSAGITSTFSRGVRFRDQSNAGTVWGGSINHCVDGVYVDGSNGIAVIKTAFEDCTDGVEFATPSGAGGTNGGVVAFCRFETVTCDVNISSTSVIANGEPFQIFGTVFSSNHSVNNVSAQTVWTQTPYGIRVRGNDQSFSLRNGAVNLRDSGGAAFLEANGNVTINPDKDQNGSGTFRMQVAGAQRWQQTSSALSFSNSSLDMGQGRLLSIRTMAASLVTASAGNVRVSTNEMTFTIGGASGASLLIHSGGTIYGFESSFSVKAT